MNIIVFSAAFIVITLQVIETHGLQCIFCSSRSNGNCQTDPIKTSRVACVFPHAKEFCLTYTVEYSSGDFIHRGCHSKNCSSVHELLQKQHLRIKDCQDCSTDLCNKGTSLFSLKFTYLYIFICCYILNTLQ